MRGIPMEPGRTDVRSGRIFRYQNREKKYVVAKHGILFDPIADKSTKLLIKCFCSVNTWYIYLMVTRW